MHINTDFTQLHLCRHARVKNVSWNLNTTQIFTQLCFYSSLQFTCTLGLSHHAERKKWKQHKENHVWYLQQLFRGMHFACFYLYRRLSRITSMWTNIWIFHLQDLHEQKERVPTSPLEGHTATLRFLTTVKNYEYLKYLTIILLYTLGRIVWDVSCHVQCNGKGLPGAKNMIMVFLKAFINLFIK